MNVQLSGNTIKLTREKRIKNLQNLLNLQEIPCLKNQGNLLQNVQNLLILEKKSILLKSKKISNLLNLKQNNQKTEKSLPSSSQKKYSRLTKKAPSDPTLKFNNQPSTKKNTYFSPPYQKNSRQLLKKNEIFIDFSHKRRLRLRSSLEQNWIILWSRLKRITFKKNYSFFQEACQNFKKNISFLFLRLGFFFRPSFACGWQKKFIAFLSISLISSFFVSGIVLLQKINFSKKIVLGKAAQSLYHFQEGGRALLDKKFELAAGEFRVAEFSLLDIQNDIKNIDSSLVALAQAAPKKNKIKQGIKITQIAQESAQAAEKIANILARFDQVNPVYGKNQFILNKKFTLTEALNRSQEDFYEIVFHLKNINQILKTLDLKNRPANEQKSLKIIKDKSLKLQTTIEGSLKYFDTILSFLGHRQKRRYLLLFQNNNEIRATGGFIGSYALLDFDQGKVEKLKLEGIYNPAGQLALKIKPPQPIRFMNKQWNIQDSNWFPDFSVSAEKTAWFLEKSGGPSVDGVIALTPDVIIDLLRLTGPIEMDEYQTKIDASNFVSQTQREVELEYDKKLNQPKKFLADLAPKLLNKIFDENKIPKIKLLEIIKNHLQAKNLLLFSFDPTIEQFFKDQNWSGRIKSAPKDYLLVVNSNISGGKTDNLIKETIELKVVVQEDGEIINYLEIHRKHTGNNEWPSTKNIVYQRIYTPSGSELLESRGFDKIEIPQESTKEEHFQEDPLLKKIEQSKKITSNNTEIFEEEGKTVFANWIALNPGEEKTVLYKYRLPFRADLKTIDHYSLLLQKQAGSFGSDFKLSIYLPRNIKAVWKNQNQKIQEGFGLVQFTDILNEDKYFGVALTKQ